jgi:Protein of unknown function (DUF2934)
MSSAADGNPRWFIGTGTLCPCLDDEVEVRRTELRHTKIERLAYYVWHIGGEQIGHADIDWLIAEHVFETGRFRMPKQLTAGCVESSRHILTRSI